MRTFACKNVTNKHFLLIKLIIKKQTMKIKALLFAAAAMVGVSAIAQVPASTKVYIDPFEADPGQKVIVDLKLDNPEQPTMSTFQVDLVYPEGILSHAQCTRMEAFGSGNATTAKDGW
ncbi:MAG: hypothetical protein II087_04465, partial [Muribaculaceae bacterium]|nr:hypothetical protein [Muribaculaceae bacterium]